MDNRIDKELIDPMIEPSSEKAHRIARSTLSMVPLIGGTSVEAFNAIIEPPMLKRKTEWMVQVTEVINKLLDDGVITENTLQNNERFMTTLINASAIAIKNHDQEKLKALRNVICNSAMGKSPDDVMQNVYLQAIDSFTSWHIKILHLIDNPMKWAEHNNHEFPKWNAGLISGAIRGLLENAFPEMVGNFEIYNTVWKELFTKGFITQEGYNVDRSKPVLESRTTKLGSNFIKFIGEPNT